MKTVTYLTILSLGLLITGLTYAGTISGTITYAGDAPARQMMRATKDQHCMDAMKSAHSEALVVSKDGGIKNVVVSLRARGAKPTPPAKNPVMDQVGCMYFPHVLAVVAGTTVDIKSSDPVAHNVHSHAKTNTEAAVNWQIPQPGKAYPLKLEKREAIKFTCDVHNWMTGWIVVVDNNYFTVTGSKDKDGKWMGSDDFETSNDKGTYMIKDVPAGKYRVQAWHEELGTATKKVEITGDETVEIPFTSADFKKKSK
jgi:plastocyanin